MPQTDVWYLIQIPKNWREGLEFVHQCAVIKNP